MTVISYESPRGSDPARKWAQRAIGFVALVAVLSGAWLYWRYVSTHGAAPPAGPGWGQGPLVVGTVLAQKRTIPMQPKYLGQAEASQTVEIRSRVRGFLQERLFEEGQRVKKGQPLFRIEPRSFQAELEMAVAGLAGAQARLEMARQQLARYNELVERKSATATELEQWQKEERVAASDVAADTARITEAKLNLSYTKIDAPLTGIVGRSLKDVGSYVDEGANGLLDVIQQTDPIYVRYSVSESDLLRWQRMRAAGELTQPEVEQLSVQVTLSDGRIYPVLGKINFVGVQVDPSTGTAIVRGTIPNPDDVLRPGQFVYVTVIGVERIGAVLVPQKSVIQSPAGSSVYILNDKGVIESRPVTALEWYGDEWIIDKGLVGGERVLVDGLLMARPGMPAVAAQTSTTAPAAGATAGSTPATAPVANVSPEAARR